MRECKVTLNGNSAEVSQVCEFVSEHSATKLVVVLNDELKSSDISYYTLCFKPGAALKNPPEVKVTTDMLKAENGSLTYPLPQTLTRFGSLDAQVQAHITDENNALVSLIKSPVFRLSFEPSITGEEHFIITDANGFIAQLHKALEELNLTVDAAEELFDKINEAFESGELKGDKGDKGDKGEKGDTGPKGDKGEKGDKGADALINGYNAVTLKSGNNLRLSQQGSEITLDFESIPVFFALPENAQYGDVCLYAETGIITEKHSGKCVAVNWEGLKNAITPDTVFEFILYKDGEQTGYVAATFGSADETTAYEQVIMFESADENWYISLNESGLDTNHSYCEKEGVKEYLTELPILFRLPEFDRADTVIENVKDNILCTSLVPMYYFGKWCRFESSGIPAVHELPTGASDGDMCLYSPMNVIESGKRIYFDWAEFAKPVDEQGYTMLWFDAKADDVELLFDISAQRNEQGCEFTVNITPYSGYKSLTVYFENGVFVSGSSVDGEVETTYSAMSELPEYIDLPRFTTFQAEEIEGGSPLFYAPYRLMVYRCGEWQSAEELFGTDCTAAEKVRIPEQDPLETSLRPNVFYDFGKRISVYIPKLIEGDPDKHNEYMFSFISGETATELTLPSSVQWVNELTVEANKRYEISIVDNIGLWCAVDLAVSN